jgi:hypothetical protein
VLGIVGRCVQSVLPSRMLLDETGEALALENRDSCLVARPEELDDTGAGDLTAEALLDESAAAIACAGQAELGATPTSHCPGDVTPAPLTLRSR